MLLWPSFPFLPAAEKSLQSITICDHYLIFNIMTHSKTSKAPHTEHVLPLHAEVFWGLLLAYLNFVVDPRSHAARNTAESDIGNEVNEADDGIVTIEINTDVEAGCDDSKKLQAVVAANQAHVIGIQSKSILPHDDCLRSGDSHWIFWLSKTDVRGNHNLELAKPTDRS